MLLLVRRRAASIASGTSGFARVARIA